MLQAVRIDTEVLRKKCAECIEEQPVRRQMWLEQRT